MVDDVENAFLMSNGSIAVLVSDTDDAAATAEDPYAVFRRSVLRDGVGATDAVRAGSLAMARSDLLPTPDASQDMREAYDHDTQERGMTEAGWEARRVVTRLASPDAHRLLVAMDVRVELHPSKPIFVQDVDLRVPADLISSAAPHDLLLFHGGLPPYDPAAASSSSVGSSFGGVTKRAVDQATGRTVEFFEMAHRKSGDGLLSVAVSAYVWDDQRFASQGEFALLEGHVTNRIVVRNRSDVLDEGQDEAQDEAPPDEAPPDEGEDALVPLQLRIYTVLLSSSSSSSPLSSDALAERGRESLLRLPLRQVGVDPFRHSLRDIQPPSLTPGIVLEVDEGPSTDVVDQEAAIHLQIALDRALDVLRGYILSPPSPQKAREAASYEAFSDASRSESHSPSPVFARALWDAPAMLALGRERLARDLMRDSRARLRSRLSLAREQGASPWSPARASITVDLALCCANLCDAFRVGGDKEWFRREGFPEIMSLTDDLVLEAEARAASPEQASDVANAAEEDLTRPSSRVLRRAVFLAALELALEASASASVRSAVERWAVALRLARQGQYEAAVEDAEGLETREELLAVSPLLSGSSAAPAMRSERRRLERDALVAALQRERSPPLDSLVAVCDVRAVGGVVADPTQGRYDYEQPGLRFRSGGAVLPSPLRRVSVQNARFLRSGISGGQNIQINTAGLRAVL